MNHITEYQTTSNVTGQVTMSSREIAELTGKRHDNVMNDIRKMLAELEIDAPDYLGTYKAGRGNQYECFNLPKRETLILVSGYSVRMRAKIVDRWQELELKMLDLAHAKASRERARLEAPFLTDAVKYTRLSAGKDLKPYHFSNEFNLINRVVLGCSSKQYRVSHGLAANDPIRDTLTPAEIKAVEHMQRLNASLIDIGMPYEKRKERLYRVFAQRHLGALMTETVRLEA